MAMEHGKSAQRSAKISKRRAEQAASYWEAAQSLPRTRPKNARARRTDSEGLGSSLTHWHTQEKPQYVYIGGWS